jgi:F0F1-type ATP synthase delta subunit
MKYPTHIYAKALVEVLSDRKAKNSAAVANNFLEIVKRNNDEGHLREILEEASRFARGKSGVRKVTIESARALSAAQKKRLKSFIKSGDVVEEHLDPELIAGIKIILNDELQFDGSLKNKLNKVLGSA